MNPHALMTGLLEIFPYLDDLLMLALIGFLVFGVKLITARQMRTRAARAGRSIDEILEQVKPHLLDLGVVSVRTTWSFRSTEVELEISTWTRAFTVHARSGFNAVSSMYLAVDMALARLVAMEAEDAGDEAQADHRGASDAPHDEEQERATAPSAPERRSWWDVLGIRPDADRAQIDKSWRDLAKRHHPDHGGSVEAMAEINRARDEARASAS